MNVPSTSPPPPSSPLSPLPASEVDRSCRIPVLLCFCAGLAWLLAGTAFGVIASIKLHSASFLAGSAWLTYGRVFPASSSSLLYGFASQVGLGLGLWMIARLGRNHLQSPILATLSVLLWNVGMALGILGILKGDLTGFEMIELPGYSASILFASFAVIGVCGLLTLHSRQQNELLPSQWYLFGGLLAFPWLFAVAQLLLVASPVRGIMQEVVNNWYSRGFINLWLGSIGLAALFYFVPKFSGKPIYSRALAIFGFWLLFIFGSWGGMSAGAPVPRWLSSLGVVTHVMTAVAVLAVATNLFQTLQQKANGSRSDRLLRFPVLGAAAYVISSLLSIAGQLPAVGRVTDFTLYGLGVSNLFLYGFFALSLSGAIYHVAPRLTGAELPRPGLVNFHFWTAVIGAALVSIPLIAGGVAQGQAFGNPEIPFLQIVRSSIPFLGMSTLGGVLILAGFTACAINLIGLVVRGCAECCRGAAPSRLKPSAAGASL